MIVAFPYKNGDITKVLEETQELKIYEINNSFVLSEELVDVDRDNLIETIVSNKVSVLICDKLNYIKHISLANKGVTVIEGKSGDIAEQINLYIANQKNENSEYQPSLVYECKDGVCGFKRVSALEKEKKNDASKHKPGELFIIE